MSGPEHLQVTTNNRGFDRLPPLDSIIGGTIRVGESSNAEQPCIWVWASVPADFNEPNGPSVETSVELSLEDVRKLAEQLTFLADHHYQLIIPTD